MKQSLGNYAFGYDEVHTTGGSFRREQASPNGGVTGSYGLRDADGRLRTVNYIADAAGFRAAITSNEPGVESKNTAGALYNQGEVPPGPVIDETLLLAPAAPAGRLIAAPAQLLAAPAYPQQQFLAAPAPVAAPLVAQAPVHWNTQVAHAAPLATQAVAPLNHGPLFGAPGISAPVLNAPGVNIFGQLTNAAVPTVNSNPLTDGPFARFARPALSTPQALATGPLAAPLSPFQPTPLASPQLAASGQLLSAPVPAGPLAPGVAVSGPLFQQSPFFSHASQFFAPQAVAAPLAAPVAAPLALQSPLLSHQNALLTHQHQLLAQQQLIAGGRLVGHPGQLLQQPQPLLAAHAPAAIAGVAYQTQINHALAPALHGQHLAQVRL